MLTRVGVLLVFLLVVAYTGRAEDSLSALKAKAEGGDAQAQADLGVMYANGRGVPKDYTEARKWYRKAADQGHAEAQYKLGLMYAAAGQGVPKARLHGSP